MHTNNKLKHPVYFLLFSFFHTIERLFLHREPRSQHAEHALTIHII
ncbi:hypothetical protein HMPREF0454_03350 [Hafnia alvei ATCC 51873]|uniref:Uncharacterized protein n=1 Tax=Hafnia alvei ATCC 51873 TaxID=1002364 RepID=G9Y9T1_HAFAL|nr:hypothetical protein HMPREF0454_03350 [Hafnia alvei ATCC 51873]